MPVAASICGFSSTQRRLRSSTGARRCGEIAPHDIAHLRDEQWVGRELAPLAPVRLQAERAPAATHRRLAQADCLGHPPGAPSRDVRRRLLKRRGDGPFDVGVADPAGAPTRGSSSRPSNRRAAKRFRRVPTLTRCTPNSWASCPCATSGRSAQASTMRTRSARACAVLRRRVRRSSVARSSGASSSRAR